MVATMLVGCGGSSNDSKSSGGDGKKLVYWAMWSKDEPQAKVIQDAIAKYTEDTGVEVDVQFKGQFRTGVRVFSLHSMQSRPSTCSMKM